MVFSFSLSDSSLVMCRNATFLHIYFVSCNFMEFILRVFLIQSLRFCMLLIMSSACTHSFTSSFVIWIPFVSLAWLLWLVLPILCLIKVVRVGILTLDFRRKDSSFSPLTMVLTVVFIMLNFVNCFFYFYLDCHIIFILLFC